VDLEESARVRSFAEKLICPCGDKLRGLIGSAENGLKGTVMAIGERPM